MLERSLLHCFHVRHLTKMKSSCSTAGGGAICGAIKVIQSCRHRHRSSLRALAEASLHLLPQSHSISTGVLRPCCGQQSRKATSSLPHQSEQHHQEASDDLSSLFPLSSPVFKDVFDTAYKPPAPDCLPCTDRNNNPFNP